MKHSRQTRKRRGPVTAAMEFNSAMAALAESSKEFTKVAKTVNSDTPAAFPDLCEAFDRLEKDYAFANRKLTDWAQKSLSSKEAANQPFDWDPHV